MQTVLQTGFPVAAVGGNGAEFGFLLPYALFGGAMECCSCVR